MSASSSPPTPKSRRLSHTSLKSSSSTPLFSGLSRGASKSSALTSSSPPRNAHKISLGSALRPAGSISNNNSSSSRNGVLLPSTFASSDGASRSRKLVIKNARTIPTDTTSSEFTSNALQTLIRAVRAILSTPPEPIPESLQALYQLCEGLVGPTRTTDPSRNKTSQTLYDRIKIEVEKKVGESANALMSVSASALDSGAKGGTGGEAWLGQLQSTWKAFTEKMLLVRSVFLHLDRVYVLHQPRSLALWEMGLDIFRHRIVEDADLSPRITSAMVDLINRERSGEAISRPLATSLISLLTTVSPVSLTTVFVTPFTGATSTYYDTEAERLLDLPDMTVVQSEAHPSTAGGQTSTDIPAYLQHAKRRLSEEGERCDVVLGSDIKGSILRKVEESLIGRHAQTIVDRGLKTLLDEVRVEDLQLLYSLFGRVAALPCLKNAFGHYVKTKGKSIVSDPTRDEQMIPSLIVLQSDIETVLSKSFANDADLTKISRESFVTFINSRQNKPSEMIAKFIDTKMKAGNKSMNDSELEQTFKSVLTLFRYCQGKDIFEAFYKKDFAKRLLLNKSASSDAEKSMLLKLREECGPAFTAKLETMAKDIDLSADIMKAYKESIPPDSANILSVNVLTTGNWPSYSKTPCRIPDDLQRELDKFSRFYKLKYTGRSLAFIHSLDYMTLKIEFDKGAGGGKKELSVSLHQALCLLLFDGAERDAKFGFKEIVEQTGLEQKEAVRTLQSLACAKHKLLTKHPKGKEVNATDEFTFNHGFKDDKYKLKINQIQQKETVEEQAKTEKQVLLDRQSHLQLVIVRILKSRKTIKHTELIMEVVNTLKERFKVDPIEIKKAIDSLIDRDYMERNGRDAYNYLA